MGLFKAAGNAVSGVLSDQWKEMFYTDSLDNNLLMIKATFRRGKNSQNKTKNNVITDGSLICVADGQAAIVVENGKVIGLYKDPGENVYHSDLSKGVFSGSGGLSSAAKDAWDRFTFGGDLPGYDQRVYYINTKSILNKDFWVEHCPVRMVDEKAGIDIDARVTVTGVFSYRVVDPIVFYKNHAGNCAVSFFEDRMTDYIKEVLTTYLYSSVATIVGSGTRPSYALAHIPEIREAIKSGVNAELVTNSGVEIDSLALDGFRIYNEDMRVIAQMQRDAAYTNPTLAGAAIVGAQTDAMRTAAANPGRVGFAAVNVAAAPVNAAAPGSVAAGNVAAPGVRTTGNVGSTAGVKIKHRCTGCGQLTEDKFCQNCGTRNPEHS